MIDHNIVRDLLPLYIDGLASEETNTTVREHLESCLECRKIYEQMKTPLAPSKDIDEKTNIIDFLKKIRRETWQRAAIIFAAALIGIGAIAGVIGYYALIGTPINSEDMVVNPQMYSHGFSGGNEEIWQVHIAWKPSSEGYIANSPVLFDEFLTIGSINGKVVARSKEVAPRKVIRLFVTTTEYSWYFPVNEDGWQDTTVTIRFADKDVVYRIVDGEMVQP